MKKQRMMKLCASVLVGTILLTGCGDTSEQSGTQDSTQAGATQQESGQADGGTNEIYWFSDVSGWGPETANWSTEESPATEYMRDNLGITLKIEQPPTDASTKLGLMIASNDLPDLMSITDQDIYKQLVEADKVWDMQTFLETYDPDSHLLEDFPADIRQALTDTYGNWYSYPSHMESANNRENFPPDDQLWVDVVEKGSNSCIMLNKDIMDALGITQEDVSTESGFYAACEKVKASGYQVDGQSVLPVVLHWNVWIDSSLDSIIAWNFGALPVDENGKYRHTELSPGYKNALKFLNTLVQKGYLDVNTLTIDETAGKTYLDAKRVFCWIGNQAQQDKANMPWVSYGPILADNGAKPVMPIDMSAGTGWIQTLVSKDCKNPEKIAELLSWASSEEGLMVNYYGAEGTDYTIDENGVVTRTEDGLKNYAEMYDSNVLLWPFANTSFERHTEPVPDPASNRGVEVSLMPAFGKYEGTYIYDASLLGFTNSTVIEPSSDLGIKLSQVDNYLESQKAKIVTASDDSTFEKEYQSMIDTLNEYSITDIDAEYDKVYQEYCGKKNSSIEDVNAGLY
ncbi:MAG: extracellular solute-binding protein [Ruminococcus flavefaciens]|nr:extracellular solute-binding protein [Eubacterium sp.]MCM1235188.1 extracellular solute-binding protein [Ruminococcus flavefaciens]